jgi:PHS family inorganic phosphate transporter-like MFS transporter
MPHILSRARSERSHAPTALSEVERPSADTRPPFVLNRAEAKLLGIAGIGFLLDAYDLFIINPVATMLMYRLYTTTNGSGSLTTHSIPPGLEGFLKASANIGSVIGQFSFGYAADALGRKAVYGKELMLIILATILCLTTPTGTLSPNACIIYLSVFRILLGVGVGGDYPMSASVTSDRSNLRKRGTMLAYIFSAQGWGSLLGSLCTIIVLKCYEHAMQAGNGTQRVSLVDGVWRIVVGLSLIPAFGTLYQRLTLPESVRFKDSQKVEGQGNTTVNGTASQHSDDELEKLKREQRIEEREMADGSTPLTPTSNGSAIKHEKEKENDGVEVHDATDAGRVDDNAREVDVQGGDELDQVVKKQAHFGGTSSVNGGMLLNVLLSDNTEFIKYFSEWRHAKVLLGTCGCWFLLDISFYGINLNQNVVLQQIGFDGSTGTPWERLFRISTGGIIITALGFVPGYYATVLTIEILGRKFIQIMGFLLTALFLGILAGRFHELSTVSFVVCFAFLQFFFNFGPNTTTYCYPAEVFPTRFKAFAHGISAAAGKAGAIISALAFNSLSDKVGTPVVLWIFFGCNIAGAALTLLLPEVKGRDADVVLAEELREKRERRGRV